jgi:hypothetical protein
MFTVPSFSCLIHSFPQSAARKIIGEEINTCRYFREREGGMQKFLQDVASTDKSLCWTDENIDQFVKLAGVQHKVFTLFNHKLTVCFCAGHPNVHTDKVCTHQ